MEKELNKGFTEEEWCLLLDSINAFGTNGIKEMFELLDNDLSIYFAAYLTCLSAILDSLYHNSVGLLSGKSIEEMWTLLKDGEPLDDSEKIAKYKAHFESDDIVSNFKAHFEFQMFRKHQLDKVFLEYSDIENIRDIPNSKLMDIVKTISATVDKIDKRTESQQTMTEYDEALINHGYIDSDFNAIHSAPNIAVFLIDQMQMESLKPEILQRYKYKGEPFTLETARKAVSYAKAKLGIVNGKKD